MNALTATSLPASRLRVVETMTDMDTLPAFETWMRSWGASERTIRDRTIAIKAGLRAWGPADTTTPQDLVDWLARPHLSQWSRLTYLGHLKSYFGWLEETGQLEHNPAARLRRPREPGDNPRPLPSDQIALILAHADTDERAWFLLGALAGLRVHECAKLRGQDVGQDTISVRGKGRRDASIPTHPLLWAEAMGRPDRGFWFPSTRRASGHKSSEAITLRMTRLFRSLGIEGSHHRGRHTFATELLRNGENIRVVQELMRHSSLASTQKYLGVTSSERCAAVRGLQLPSFDAA